MLRNYFLINLILIIILSFLGFKLYRTIRATEGVPVASESRQQKDRDVNRKRPLALNESIYDVITQKDLFRPSRSAANEKMQKTTETTAPKNPPKLFGTVILNDKKTAILQDSESRTTKTYKLNELISGYTIAEIQEDKVVLEKDGEKFDVKLREDKGIQVPLRQAVRKDITPAQTVKPGTTPIRRPKRPRRVRRNVPQPPK